MPLGSGVRPEEQEEEEEAYHGQEGDQEKALAYQEELDLINHAEYHNCEQRSGLYPVSMYLPASGSSYLQRLQPSGCQCQAQQPRRSLARLLQTSDTTRRLVGQIIMIEIFSGSR